MKLPAHKTHLGPKAMPVRVSVAVPWTVETTIVKLSVILENASPVNWLLRWSLVVHVGRYVGDRHMIGKKSSAWCITY